MNNFVFSINSDKLEKILSEKIVGQEKTIALLAKAIKRVQKSKKQNNKVVTAFIFVGPQSVDKKSLAIALSQIILNQEQVILYQNQEQLMQSVKEQPKALIIFEKIEKADKNVLNFFEKILNKGEVADKQNNIVDFKNTIIILDSNIGSASILESDHEITEHVHKKVIDLIQQSFSENFLNMIDEVIMFPVPLENNN